MQLWHKKYTPFAMWRQQTKKAPRFTIMRRESPLREGWEDVNGPSDSGGGSGGIFHPEADIPGEIVTGSGNGNGSGDVTDW